ncbi:MAG TPA: aromatic ring-hydroxylating dioxygenase subunit alpha [Enhygromyxa sp.]|nr:aromatic ring-hydroxylating dioxygenase subunit alpha [Enhygromyxa sp.]
MADGQSRTPFEQASAVRHKARLAGMNPNYWYPLEWSDRIAPGGVGETTFWGESIALFRGDDGRARALENRCAHRQIKLTLGHVRGCDLVCLYHGWRYDQGGRLVEMKHDQFGKKLPVISIRSYPVRERYGLIWGYMGDPADAEAVPLPEIEYGDGDDRWAAIRFDYTWRAHHYMVIDNLCNLTHLYVHGRWVPYDQTTLTHHSLSGDRIELNWHHTLRRDPGLYPIYKAVFGSSSDRQTSDTHMVFDYPYQRALSNGRIRSCNFMLPEQADRTRVFSIQFWKAPTLPGSSRQLPRAVMQRLFAPSIKPITKEIFRQDGATVEGEQQAVMGEHFDKPMPEPNPSVRLFERLTIERWQAHLDARATGAKPSLCTRVKQL